MIMETIGIILSIIFFIVSAHKYLTDKKLDAIWYLLLAIIVMIVKGE